MKKPKSILSLLEYIDGCWYAVYPKCGVKVRCNDQYSAYVKQLELLKAPCPRIDVKPTPEPPEPPVIEYYITISYNELEDCSVEAYPMSVQEGQSSTLTITAPDDVEWTVRATNATLIGPTYDTGNGELNIVKIIGNVLIEVNFEKEIIYKTIRYESIQPVSGDWVDENTHTELNTWNEQTNVGILYLNEELESIAGKDNPFYNNSNILSINLNNSQLTNIGAYAFAFAPSMKYDEEKIGWLTAEVNNGITILDYNESLPFYDDGGPKGNYSQNLNIWHTIMAPTDTRIMVTFSEMQLGSGSYLDYYYRPYTGSEGTMGTRDGRRSGSTTYTIISTGNVLTFHFTCTSQTRSGWEGTITVINSTDDINLLDNLSDLDNLDNSINNEEENINVLLTNNIDLTNVNVNTDIRQYQSNLTSVIMPDTITTISESSFENCICLKSISLPNNITSIGKKAFKGCNNLVSIMIPDTVVTIGEDAFINCNNLIYAKLSNNLTTISKELFKDCTNLESITIPNSVSDIGDYSFNNCKSLKNLTVPNSVLSVGNHAFEGCSGLISIELACNIIRSYAFAHCDSLTSITVHNNVEFFDYAAFTYCMNLNAIYYIGTIEQWCNITFYEAHNPLYEAHNLYINNELLIDLIIPNTVTEIKEGAFNGASNLRTISFPEFLTVIKNASFNGTINLTTVTFKSTIPPIMDGIVYFGFERFPCYVPENSIQAYENSTWNSSFSEFLPIPE